MQLDMSFDGYSGIAGLQEGLGRTNATGGWSQGTNESEAGGGATTDVKAHRLYAGVDSGANAAQDGDNFYHFCDAAKDFKRWQTDRLDAGCKKEQLVYYHLAGPKLRKLRLCVISLQKMPRI